MSPAPQAERIRQAVMCSVNSRDLYTKAQVKSMFGALRSAETNVKAELLRIKERSIISKGLEVRRSQLKGIQREIDSITRDLRKEMSLISRRSMTGAYRKSFDDVVNEWADMGVPSYSGLSHAERLKLAADAFSLVDRKALDFLVNYELQLLGNVSHELAEGIKNHITIGLIQGESLAKISRNIGGIITDPEAFRRAGKTVFRTAQTRTETIVRTETLRAYNQGRHKFYKEVGVKWIRWMSVGDKRTCPICRELDGKKFKLGKAPGPPKHPQCRCTIFVDPKSLGIKDKPVVVEKPKPKPKPKPEAKPKKPTCTKDMPPPEWFKEAKTVKEAEDFALKNLCQKSELVGEYATKVDYSGMSVDSVNEVNRALAKLQSRGLPKVTQIVAKSNKEMDDAIAAMRFHKGTKSLRLNNERLKTPTGYQKYCQKRQAKYAKNYKKNLEEYEALLKKEKKGVKLSLVEQENIEELHRGTLCWRESVTDSLEDTIQHEMGHLFHFTGNQSLNADRVFLRECPFEDFDPWLFHMNQLGDECRKIEKWARKISDYGQTDGAEFLAESFNCYHRGEFKSIHPKLLKAFEEFFGRIK